MKFHTRDAAGEARQGHAGRARLRAALGGDARPALRREVRQQRAVAAGLPRLADPPLHRGPPRRRHPARRPDGAGHPGRRCAGCASAGVAVHADAAALLRRAAGADRRERHRAHRRARSTSCASSASSSTAPAPGATCCRSSCATRPGSTASRRPARSSSRSSSARATRGSAPGTSGPSSSRSSASRSAQGAAERAGRSRCSTASPPARSRRKHHLALRGAGRRAAPRGGLHARRLRRPLHPAPTTCAAPTRTRAAEARHGWAAPAPAAVRGGWRGATTGRRSCPAAAGRPSTPASPLLWNDDVVARAGARPTEADPVYFRTATATSSSSSLEGGGLLRTAARRPPLRGRRLPATCRGACSTASCPTPGRSAGSRSRLAAPAPPGAVAQRGRPAAHGRALLPPRLPPRGLAAAARRGAARARREAGRRLPRLPAATTRRSTWSGWDGAVYPFAFPILAFQPRVGLVHLPPTWHGTFAARGALVCSFVPRVVDFHPDAIPCPYPHASVDVDEVLFYVRGQFTCRARRRAGLDLATTRPASSTARTRGRTRAPSGRGAPTSWR